MKKVLILGAGKSSTVLIEYMLKNSSAYNWQIIVADIDINIAQQKISGSKKAKAIYFNVNDQKQLNKNVAKADAVISLLPASMHLPVAKACVKFKKHFISASYVSDEMLKLHEDAVSAGIILLNEMGLDPGIDHMSAMRMIDEIKNLGGKITAFESYTGGLIAPESDDNPWHYKFTWNPRNVVVAGQGTAKFLWKNQFKYIPYHKLFTRYDIINIDGYGEFEGYPNRNSLQYKNIYGLQDAGTIVRGTLRKRGFCDAWNVFVQLGMTDDSYLLDVDNFSWNDFTASFLPPNADKSTEENLASYLGVDSKNILEKLVWLGLFSDEKTNMPQSTPAYILLKLLEKKWKLNSGDKDMCVMTHIVEYTLDSEVLQRQSNMVVIGDDELHTAMAKTVGLPLGIAAKMILNGEIVRTGVVIPVTADIYIPVLQELEQDFEIKFEGD